MGAHRSPAKRLAETAAQTAARQEARRPGDQGRQDRARDFAERAQRTP